MTPPKLREGDCYFLVTYHDEAMHLPAIETYVYLGRNILPAAEPSEERWFFQTAESTAADGRFDPQTDEPADKLLVAGADMIDEFCDVDELIARLGSFAARRGDGGDKRR